MMLFEENENTISQTAWACVVYSMVPYLGILFVPFAFIAGGLGIYASRRRPEAGSGRLATVSICLALMICVAQILLWWLLYIVPVLAMPA